MKRSSFLARSVVSLSSSKPRKEVMKTCANKECRTKFTQARPMQKVCSPLCALVVGRAAAAKKREQEAKADRAETRARKEKIKTIPQLKKEAQIEFNKWVRLRDAEQLCICCGKPLDHDSSGVGGGYDAGHYRSIGSAPHLRFDERNVHAQRKSCNRYGAGRAVDYRIGLIRRIGLAAVESLESDCRIHKWTRDELIGIRTTYRAKANALAKQRKEQEQ